MIIRASLHAHMESVEEQEWIGLVIRALRSVDELDDEQIQETIEVAHSIRSQLRRSPHSASTIALMMMQLDDVESKMSNRNDFDPAFA